MLETSSSAFSAEGILMSSNNGWLMASSMLILKNGLNTRSLSRKSIASGGADGYLMAKLVLAYLGKVLMYSIAWLSVMKLVS